MKKGFTLIELLAVILILGIIALIAIPTVNKIINEARYGAFKSGNDNILKTVQETCQSDLIKGEYPTLSYTFTNKNISSEIDVKGSIPEDGFIMLDKNCNIEKYNLNTNNFTYSNNYEGIPEDYVIKTSSKNNSIIQNFYSNYYKNIKTISFINHMEIPNNAINIKDISMSNNGTIKSWLLSDGDKYNLFIGSEGIIYANPNSSYLFANMENLETIDFINFDTRYVNQMKYMFANDKKLENIDLLSFDTSNVVDMQFMFYNCSSMTEINVANWNINKLVNTSNMFNNCKELLKVDLSNWKSGTYLYANKMFGIYNFTLNKSSMKLEEIILPTEKNSLLFVDCSEMFASCLALQNINLSGFNTERVKNFYAMFYHCRELTNIDVSTINTKSAKRLEAVFQGCYKLLTIDVSHFITNNVEYAHGMFAQCTSLTHVYGLEHWDTGKMKRISSMFNTATKLEYINMSNWNTSKIEDPGLLFYGCENLEEINLGNWDSSKFKYFDKIFQNCKKLKNLDISNWTIPNGASMINVFTGAQNLTNIKISNAETLNQFINLLPSRTSNEPGNITIMGDRVGIDLDTLSSKNWNVI